MNAPIRHKEKVTVTLSPQQIREIVKGMTLEQICEGVTSPGHPDRIGSYQYTHSGRIFFPCDPRPEEVFIDDIAHGVAGIMRFNSQTKRWMTVAEHLWHASFLVPKCEALEAHMHDTAEGYISDLIRPLKAVPIYGDIYLMIENGIMRAIGARYGLDLVPMSKNVFKADEVMVQTELAQNIGSQATNHLVLDPEAEACTKTKLFYWPPALAQTMWLHRFNELATARGIDVRAIEGRA